MTPELEFMVPRLEGTAFQAVRGGDVADVDGSEAESRDGGQLAGEQEADHLRRGGLLLALAAGFLGDRFEVGDVGGGLVADGAADFVAVAEQFLDGG